MAGEVNAGNGDGVKTLQLDTSGRSLVGLVTQRLEVTKYHSGICTLLEYSFVDDFITFKTCVDLYQPFTLCFFV